MKIVVNYNDNQETIIELNNFNYKIVTKNSKFILEIMNINEDYDFNDKLLLYNLYDILNNNLINDFSVYGKTNKLIFNLKSINYQVEEAIVKESVEEQTLFEFFIAITLSKKVVK